MFVCMANIGDGTSGARLFTNMRVACVHVCKRVYTCVCVCASKGEREKYIVAAAIVVRLQEFSRSKMYDGARNKSIDESFLPIV